MQLSNSQNVKYWMSFQIPLSHATNRDLICNVMRYTLGHAIISEKQN